MLLKKKNFLAAHQHVIFAINKASILIKKYFIIKSKYWLLAC